MNISVIICTFNRAESLRRTLSTLCEATVPPGVAYEVLVVDNNSTDHTRSVCEEFCSRLPLRYLFEPRQGKSLALNMAIERATADLLIFTDDDADIDPKWLESYWRACQRHPDASIFGGRVYPRLPMDTPAWFAAHANDLLRFATGYFDPGEEEVLGNWTFLGANMALRKSVFRDEEGYRQEVSIIGNSVRCIRGAEENEIQNRLRRKGHQALYVPSAVVHHRLLHLPSEAYVRATFRSNGINEVRLGEVSKEHLLFKVPRYYWKQAALHAVKYCLTRWCGPPRIWLKAEIQMAHAWGVISECRRTAD
jgi:glycosyltransferase involved in cell wall biosynthesis